MNKEERAAVESFVRVAKRLTVFWSYADIEEYLRNIIKTDRTDRIGFPEDTLSELVFLYQLVSNYPELVLRAGEKIKVYDPTEFRFR
jgi:hypothetical protein